jgi:hypothetical protein
MRSCVRRLPGINAGGVGEREGSERSGSSGNLQMMRACAGMVVGTGPTDLVSDFLQIQIGKGTANGVDIKMRLEKVR